MKKIKLLEQAAENNSKFTDLGINPTFAFAYFNAQETGNEMLDFDEVIWDTDVEEIIKNCKEHGITAFTISNTFSGLTKTIAKFISLGCTLDGMTTVNSKYKDWETKQRKRIPAFLLSL